MIPPFNLCDRRVWYGNSPRESLQRVGDPTGRKQDVTREIVRPVDLAGDELPSSLEAFCRPTPRLRLAGYDDHPALRGRTAFHIAFPHNRLFQQIFEALCRGTLGSPRLGHAVVERQSLSQ